METREELALLPRKAPAIARIIVGDQNTKAQITHAFAPPQKYVLWLQAKISQEAFLFACEYFGNNGNLRQET
jgi:hypothetical protein